MKIGFPPYHTERRRLPLILPWLGVLLAGVSAWLLARRRPGGS